MAKKIKEYYDLECAQKIGFELSRVFPLFDKKSFVKELKRTLDPLEFSERLNAFAALMEKYLPDNFSDNLTKIKTIIGPPYEHTTGMFIQSYWLFPISRYVERNALLDYDSSLNFCFELTQRLTSEFAVRPLLINQPAKTMKQFLKWSRHQNPHVRRLSSEGMRIYLPWAKKSLAALAEPLLYERILTQLNADSSLYVQKSVANNINDLFRVNPELANEIIKKWKNQNADKSTGWIIKHALRNQ